MALLYGIVDYFKNLGRIIHEQCTYFLVVLNEEIFLEIPFPVSDNLFHVGAVGFRQFRRSGSWYQRDSEERLKYFADHIPHGIYHVSGILHGYVGKAPICGVPQ